MTPSLAFHKVGSATTRSVRTESRLLLYAAGVATLARGILHLIMIGPSLKPYNFPMELLPYADTLFIIAGIAQVFWALPMIRNWGVRWYYIGMLGTITLTMLLVLTGIPNEITGTALQDGNPMALLTEIVQSLHIGVTVIIIVRKKKYSLYKKQLKIVIFAAAIPKLLALCTWWNTNNCYRLQSIVEYKSRRMDEGSEDLIQDSSGS